MAGRKQGSKGFGNGLNFDIRRVKNEHLKSIIQCLSKPYDMAPSITYSWVYSYTLQEWVIQYQGVEYSKDGQKLESHEEKKETGQSMAQQVKEILEKQRSNQSFRTESFKYSTWAKSNKPAEVSYSGSCSGPTVKDEKKKHVFNESTNRSSHCTDKFIFRNASSTQQHGRKPSSRTVKGVMRGQSLR